MRTLAAAVTVGGLIAINVVVWRAEWLGLSDVVWLASVAVALGALYAIAWWLDEEAGR